MAKKFRGVQIVKEIEDAMDKGMARFLTNTQSKLSAASPVDTGRLASSWMIGQRKPNRTVPPEAGIPAEYETIEGVSVKIPGTNKPDINVRRYSGVITIDSNWYISSNLPYSNRACFDPKWAKGGRRGGAQWFTSIVNNLDKDAERSFGYFLRQVK